MAWLKNGRYLTAFGALVVGFLFIMLLKAQGLMGSQALSSEKTALPNLIQLDLENQQLANDNNRLRQELDKYNQGLSISALTQQHLNAARLNAGLTSVRGSGIRITLNDSNRQVEVKEEASNYVIHEGYILQLLNILWNGGAEAISVNGQRVTSNTEVYCSGTFIQINGTRQVPPYVIEAIGDATNLQASLKFYYQWDELGYYQEKYGITRTLEVLDTITMPAAKQREYSYAKPVKE